ncbi:MAG: NupC/NupG family nucleoside CNT transporter [Planctomycetota bacterium]
MERFASVLGIFVLLGIGYACSSARRKVPWRLVVVGILLQVWLALFIVRADWVPWLLPAAAGLCTLILVVGLRKELPGYWLPAARGLGLLGLFTTLVYAAILAGTWWVWLLVLASFWAATWPGRPARDVIAIVGCLAVLVALWLMKLPEDFVFQGVAGVGRGVKGLVDFATRGADEVFGGLRDVGGFVFAIDIGAIILLFGGLLSVLYHIGVIPWLVGLMARVLHRALGVSGAESLAAASNVFVGQTEAPLVIRAYLPEMTRSEIMALMTGGFATIAGSVLGAYIMFLQGAGFREGAAHLIAASVMSAPAAFVFAKLFVPETEVSRTRDGAVASREALGTNLLDALASGVTAALKLAVNVVAMLLVFYALIFLLDDGVEWVARVVFGAQDMTFQQLYAHLFRPFACLIGVPADDTLAVGQLLGTKTIFNEFIAYQHLGGMIEKGEIQTRSAVLSTYALCGFANFMSIGIQIAGLGQLAPGKRSVFARLALRAMVAGALACQLTACIVGVIGRF